MYWRMDDDQYDTHDVQTGVSLEIALIFAQQGAYLRRNRHHHHVEGLVLKQVYSPNTEPSAAYPLVTLVLCRHHVLYTLCQQVYKQAPPTATATATTSSCMTYSTPKTHVKSTYQTPQVRIEPIDQHCFFDGRRYRLRLSLASKASLEKPPMRGYERRMVCERSSCFSPRSSSKRRYVTPESSIPIKHDIDL
ncbi:hypothetical protein CIB48_g291 [Xylaria polymorpha]|nr:hypothetical protein CIB48_g291 [Xylaria polymorpha]